LDSALSYQQKKTVDKLAREKHDNSSLAAQAALQDSLKKLRPYYLATLNEALGELDILYGKIAAKRHKPADVKSVSDITHKIAGVAPMLGFEGLGRMAASLERVAIEHSSAGNSTCDSEALLSELNRLLDGIENELVLGY